MGIHYSAEPNAATIYKGIGMGKARVNSKTPIIHQREFQPNKNHLKDWQVKKEEETTSGYKNINHIFSGLKQLINLYLRSINSFSLKVSNK